MRNKTGKKINPRNRYCEMHYNPKRRWISYWYQINEVLRQKPGSVLEIGIGNQTVSGHLKKVGIKVTTCDFDKSLKPDVFADILDLPFKKDNFDVVLCAEVLEHLPFENFEKGLEQIFKVTKKTAVITLPHYSLTNIYFGIKLVPYVPKIELHFEIDYPIENKYDGEHYWEIGKKGYSLKRVKSKIKKTGFKIDKIFRPIENPYHHFFILKK